MVDGLMDITALFSDVYFWAALLLFILSIAGIFLILKALQKSSESNLELPESLQDEFSKTVRIAQSPAPRPTETPRALGVEPVTLESLNRMVRQMDETLSKIEKKMNEQNTDQMNEMAGQLKLIVQMLKTNNISAGSDASGPMKEKVDKMYQILSTLSQAEQK